MSLRKIIFSIIIISSFSSASFYSRADNLKLTIIPTAHLAAGKLSDNTLLARVYISGISKSCNVNVWDEMAENESTPGHYTLTIKDNGRGFIRVKLNGAHWQPSTFNGKGVYLRASDKNSALELLSDGEQFITGSSVRVQLTALCYQPQPGGGSLDGKVEN
ncbi:AfaD family invasin [Candidatus Pantoea formicae]|uniref:AfaD family invasin n=1 Tax=Candidatus Pantoea formicae TaxID=2608355 RepID=UPI003ED8C2DA